MDFTTLAPAFPGPLGQALSRLDFPNSAPVDDRPRPLRPARRASTPTCRPISTGATSPSTASPFDRLTIPIAYDGKRLLIPGLKIAGQAGNVDLEFFFDGTQDTPSLNGKITSNLDPTILKGVFGQGMDNFLGSCSFASGGPKIEATATGTALKTDAWTVKGKMSADKFVYKTAAFDTATSDFTFADSKLDLPNLEVHRAGGQRHAAASSTISRTARSSCTTSSRRSTCRKSRRSWARSSPSTPQPYHFTRPPLVHANGKVDLQSEKKDLDTDLVVEVDGQVADGMDALPRALQLRQPAGHAHVQEPAPDREHEAVRLLRRRPGRHARHGLARESRPPTRSTST